MLQKKFLIWGMHIFSFWEKYMLKKKKKVPNLPEELVSRSVRNILNICWTVIQIPYQNYFQESDEVGELF